MTNKNLLYVYGPSASGKGVLMRLLDGHPELAVHTNHDKLPKGITEMQSLSEIKPSIYFQRVRKALCNTGYYRFEDNHHERKIGFATEAEEYNKAGHEVNIDFYKAEKEWTEQVVKDRPETKSEIIRIIFEGIFRNWSRYPYQPTKCRYYVGMGSPKPGPMEKMVKDDKQTKLMFLYRDPRAVVASHGGRPGKSVDTDIKNNRVLRIQNLIRTANRLSERFGDRVKIVSFRNLILRTNQTMSEVADFLNIEDSDLLRQPSFCGSKLPRGRYVGEIKDDWEEILSTRQRCAVDLQAGKVPKRVSYGGIKLYAEAVANLFIKEGYRRAKDIMKNRILR